MWRDAEADAVGQVSVDGLAQGGEALEGRVGVVTEDLQEDDRAEAELRARGRGRAREARVGERRDPRPEALGGAQARDRDRVAVRKAPLAGHVEGDPGREREAVAEARVD